MKKRESGAERNRSAEKQSAKKKPPALSLLLSLFIHYFTQPFRSLAEHIHAEPRQPLAAAALVYIATEKIKAKQNKKQSRPGPGLSL